MIIDSVSKYLWINRIRCLFECARIDFIIILLHFFHSITLIYLVRQFLTRSKLFFYLHSKIKRKNRCWMHDINTKSKQCNTMQSPFCWISDSVTRKPFMLYLLLLYIIFSMSRECFDELHDLIKPNISSHFLK